MVASDFACAVGLLSLHLVVLHVHVVPVGQLQVCMIAQGRMQGVCGCVLLRCATVVLKTWSSTASPAGGLALLLQDPRMISQSWIVCNHQCDSHAYPNICVFLDVIVSSCC